MCLNETYNKARLGEYLSVSYTKWSKQGDVLPPLLFNFVVEYAVTNFQENLVKGEAIPVTGREGPQGCETLRLPHFLDNRRGRS
jgi:hypothetical protein